MKFTAPLDAGFRPAVLFDREYASRARGGVPLVIGLEREGGLVSRHEVRVLPGGSGETLRYAERLVKFLLWARGGWRIHVGGPAEVGEHLRAAYGSGGMRAFDAELMAKVYERPVEVVVCGAGDVPAAHEVAQEVGGHLDGCRIGFDLGASDYKVAAVREGEVVFSEEFPWNPRVEADPEYHYRHLSQGVRVAASHLPRVDAIGGSSAGVIVGNKIMVASLLRSVPPEKFDAGKNLFLRLREEWGVPLEVANDGDVTALAGAMSLGEDGVLGVAMGSSEAAGFIDRKGHILGWLNELAFAPIDYNGEAPAEEWSGDRGVGALYFSQQAVNKLLPAAGIAVPSGMGLPERLKEVQGLMAKGDPRAAKIYETIGVYLGYGAAHYADFYDFRHMLILGRVTTGEGGNILLARAKAVLEGEFPDLAGRIALHLPDEKSRRVGQAVAAASLPEIRR